MSTRVKIGRHEEAEQIKLKSSTSRIDSLEGKAGQWEIVEEGDRIKEKIRMEREPRVKSAECDLETILDWL